MLYHPFCMAMDWCLPIALTQPYNPGRLKLLGPAGLLGVLRCQDRGMEQILSQSFQKEHPTNMLILDFSLLNYERINFCYFKPLSLG